MLASIDYIHRNPVTRGFCDRAMVIHAMNETRTWFPATKLVDASGEEPNNVTSVGSPGVHSDIGGHFGNNQKIQALCLTTMIEGAVSLGNAQFFPDKPLDKELEAAYNSTYTAMMAVFGAGDETGPQYNDWVDAQRYWKPLSPDQYRAMAGSWNFSDWRPGPVGAQNGEEFYNAAMVRRLNVIKYALKRDHRELADEIRFQTSKDWIVRDLDWVEKGLWDTHGGVSPDFMLYLYGLLAHPKGGWRATLDRGAEQLETPMQS
ncbi:MAG TPA: hypothetical protein DD670_12675 [Planctomycetaceae bacterium]|nr:hypothetical protein [Planctomycetaceae bacterium]